MVNDEKYYIGKQIEQPIWQFGNKPQKWVANNIYEKLHAERILYKYSYIWTQN